MTMSDVGLAEYLAFFHHKHGDDGLREALEFTIAQRRLAGSYEELKRIAAELQETGLLSAAKIVEEISDWAPHEWDCRCHWPADCASLITRWHAEMAKKKAEWETRFGGKLGHRPFAKQVSGPRSTSGTRV
jgi:hypothetical protein